MKKISIAILALTVLFVLSGCCLSHDWQAATCTKPETCSKCGETQGEALGHTWSDADCVTAKTCSVCGETEGEALGHTWADADCATPKTCSVCGETEGEALGHTWVDADCVTAKTCSVCGETEGEALGHSWADADCVTPKTCSVCGETEGDALGHTADAATCTSDSVCAVCGTVLEEAAGHDANPATQTEDSVCKNCGEVLARATGAWEKRYVPDAFGDPTEEWYLYAQVEGTISDKTVSGLPVRVEAVINEDGMAFRFMDANGYQIIDIVGGARIFDISTKDDAGSLAFYETDRRTEDGFYPIDKDMVLGLLIQLYGDGVLKVAGTDINDKNITFSFSLNRDSSSEGVAVYLDQIYAMGEQYAAEQQYRNAFRIFARLSGYRDADEQSLAVRYAQAELFFENKQYSDAANLFAQLGDYKDAPQRIEDVKNAYRGTQYEAAEALLAASDFDGAEAAFLALGDFRDAAARVQDVRDAREAALRAKYEAAEALLNASDFDGAEAAFAALGDYSDAAARIQDVNEARQAAGYEAAMALKNAGSYLEAAEAFSALGSYRDSAEQVKACVAELQAPEYEAACALQDAGKKAEAAIAFGKLGNYLDAAQKSAALWAEVQVHDVIFAGDNLTIGINPDGTLAGAGLSGSMRKETANWSNLIAVAAGTQHIMALKADGTVVASGWNKFGPCNVSSWTDIIDIAGGGNFSVGLKADGTVVAVGKNDYGQCNISDWTNIVAVSAGYSHTVGLRSDGTVVAVGDKGCSVCEVSGWTDIVAISAGFNSTIGLKADGTVVSTGYQFDGRCDVGGWSDIVAISAGRVFTLGLKADGTVVATGSNDDGQCNVSGWTGIAAISAGMNHAVGLKPDGSCIAAGENKSGQCDISKWNIPLPVKTAAPEKSGSQQVATVQGFGGPIQAVVTFSSSGAEILDVQLTGDGETPSLGGVALQEMPAQIIAAQSVDVDGISGATITCNAIREAVAAAMEAAGMVPAPQTSNISEVPVVSEYAAMSHAEYVAAELDSFVRIATYVQAHQSWWDGKVTVYAQSPDGAYFLYNMACSEADAEKLVPGTKILVDGFKSEWAGEVEIVDATFEILDGSFIAEAADVTALIDTDELADHQNEFVVFHDLTVADVQYKNGAPGDDIYVSFTKDGVRLDFCVEYYLTGTDTDVYAAVGALNVGDVVDVEGFLYWYNGANTHITAVRMAASDNVANESIPNENAPAVEGFVEAATEAPSDSATVVIEADMLRTSPTVKSPTVGQLNPGDYVEVLRIEDIGGVQWAFISADSLNMIGWIPADHLGK